MRGNRKKKKKSESGIVSGSGGRSEARVGVDNRCRGEMTTPYSVEGQLKKARIENQVFDANLQCSKPSGK